METNNKLRSALERLDELLYIGADGEVHGDRDKAQEIKRIIKAALAEPVRNCDVGTAEEQAERFVEFCDEEKGNREHCRNCRLCNAKDCTLAWSQMPYEEGGAK